eukprot:5860687-Pyramimonas_sp.AAC.1
MPRPGSVEWLHGSSPVAIFSSFCSVGLAAAPPYPFSSSLSSYLIVLVSLETSSELFVSLET